MWRLRNRVMDVLRIYPSANYSPPLTIYVVPLSLFLHKILSCCYSFLRNTFSLLCNHDLRLSFMPLFHCFHYSTFVLFVSPPPLVLRHSCSAEALGLSLHSFSSSSVTQIMSICCSYQTLQSISWSTSSSLFSHGHMKTPIQTHNYSHHLQEIDWWRKWRHFVHLWTITFGVYTVFHARCHKKLI